ncbi:hypothetical protein L6452_08145 [Arctium lappa]|uniref:Uncharacterized protein n=1 Tax=Arctium lappa TaxID=4217 RepID=A0ACB9DGI7_ARCLA|nr:hypothetical protein L6452_08145 [Arctium lappa]
MNKRPGKRKWATVVSNDCLVRLRVQNLLYKHPLLLTIITHTFIFENPLFRFVRNNPNFNSSHIYSVFLFLLFAAIYT